MCVGLEYTSNFFFCFLPSHAYHPSPWMNTVCKLILLIITVWVVACIQIYSLHSWKPPCVPSSQSHTWPLLHSSSFLSSLVWRSPGYVCLIHLDFLPPTNHTDVCSCPSTLPFDFFIIYTYIIIVGWYSVPLSLLFLSLVPIILHSAWKNTGCKVILLIILVWAVACVQYFQENLTLGSKCAIFMLENTRLRILSPTLDWQCYVHVYIHMYVCRYAPLPKATHPCFALLHFFFFFLVLLGQAYVCLPLASYPGRPSHMPPRVARPGYEASLPLSCLFLPLASHTGTCLLLMSLLCICIAYPLVYYLCTCYYLFFFLPSHAHLYSGQTQEVSWYYWL